MVNMPKKYDSFEMAVAEMRLMQVESSLDIKSELLLIGTTGVEFTHTSELHDMNYTSVMTSADVAELQVEVGKEHEVLVKNTVWEIVLKASVPPKTNILKSAWVMKPKADGSKHA